MKKKLLSILLTVCMVLSLVPAAAVPVMAEPISGVDYFIDLHNGRVTDGTNDISALVGITGSGNDQTGYTYTFDGVDFSTSTSATCAVTISDAAATIRLKGINTLEHATGNYGISASGCDLTIEGDSNSSLTVKGTGDGIYASSITVKGGTVTAIGRPAFFVKPIIPNGYEGKVYFGENKEVAETNGEQDPAVSGAYYNNSYVSLTVTAATQTTPNYTLYLEDGKVYQNDLNGSELSIPGITYYEGMYTFTEIDFTTTAETAVHVADAAATIRLLGNNTITGGSTNESKGLFGNALTIIAEGNASLVVSGAANAIQAETLTISGGTVTADGDNVGIYAKDSLTITGGTVNAKSSSGTGIVVNYPDTISITGGIVTALGLKAFSEMPSIGAGMQILGSKLITGTPELITDLEAKWDSSYKLYQYMKVEPAPPVVTPDFAIFLEGGNGYKGVWEYSEITKDEALTLADYGISASGTTYTFDGVNFTTEAPAAIYINDTDATIELVDDNTVKSVSNDNVLSSYGIQAMGSLTIQSASGTGSLTATGGNSGNYSYGIDTSGDLTVKSGTVDAISLSDNASNSADYSSGIGASGTASFEGGVVNATGGDAQYSYGIKLGGDATFSGGTVTAIGGDADTGTSGIYTASYEENAVTVFSGATVNASSMDSDSNSRGITIGADNAVSITGGSVTASGMKYGITFGSDSECTISGGTVTAIGGTVAMEEAPTVTGMDVATATETDGTTGLVSPNADWASGLSTYKYMQFTPAPTTPTLTADQVLYLYQGGLYSDSEYEDAVLVEGLTGNTTPVNGAYTYTFNNVNISSANNAAIDIDDSDAIIELVGNSTVTSGDVNSNTTGAISSNGNLTIKGSGSLTVNSGNVTDHGYSLGISVNGAITVESGTVNATGGTVAESSSYGISCYAITITGGTVNATGGTAGTDSYGILSDDISITGGTVTAIGNSSGFNKAPSVTNMKLTAGDAAPGSEITWIGDGSDSINYKYMKFEPSAVTYTVYLKEGKAYSDKDFRTEVSVPGISWDDTNGCYVFEDVDLTTTADTAIEVCDSAATIKLVGTNTVTAKNTSYHYSRGIVSIGNLSFIGTSASDSLTVRGGNADQSSYGIYNLDQVLIQNCTVDAAGGEASTNNSRGIHSTNAIRIQDATVIATGGSAANGSSYGIYSGGTVTVSGSSVIATGGSVTNRSSYGIYSYNGSISITDATVTATGGSATYGTSSGIHSHQGSVLLLNSIVTATGGSGMNSHGVYGVGNLTVTGGKLEASGNSISYAYGIHITVSGSETDASIKISGGADVIAQAVASYGVGIFVDGSISIDSSTVNATGDDHTCGINAVTDIVIANSTVTANGSEAALSNSPSTFAQQVFKGDSADGSGAAEWTDWIGDGLDDVSSYKYMKFVPGDVTHTIYLKGGKVYRDMSCTKELVIPSITGNDDAESPVYTFENLSLTSKAAPAIEIKDRAATIRLVGNSTVTSGTAASDNSYGILAVGSLTVTGEGKLTANGNDTSYLTAGICCFGDLTVQSGTVVAVGGTSDSDYSYGIYSENGSVIVNGGRVEASTKDSQSARAIYALRYITVTNATVTAAPGAAINGGSFGIYAESGVTASNSTITAIGNTGQVSFGIVSNGSVRIRGGNIIATGGDGTNRTAGIECADLTLENTASFSATGGSVTDGNSYGVYCKDTVTISGGDTTSLTIKGGSATNGNSYGIYSEGTVTVSGGDAYTAGPKVEVKGGTSTAENGNSYGIYGNLSVKGNARVWPTGGAAARGSSYGVFGNVLLEENCYITVQASLSKDTYGIKGDLTMISTRNCSLASSMATDTSITLDGNLVIHQGTVMVQGYDAANSIGISGDVEVNGGTVEVVGISTPSSINDTYGIRGKATVTGGSLTVKDFNGKQNSYGIGGGAAVNGGSLTVSGITSEGTAYGVVGGLDVDSGTVSISTGSAATSVGVKDGAVNVTGGTVTVNSGTYGIQTNGEINFTGGTVSVKANSGTQAVSKAPITSYMDVYGGSAESNAAKLTGWVGDGSDTDINHKYMLFDCYLLGKDETLYLKDGKLYSDAAGTHEVILGEGQGTVTGSVDPDTNAITYTFDNVSLNSNAPTAIHIVDDNATVELKGSNTVTLAENADTSDPRYGIYANGNLTVTGDGSLHVTVGAAENANTDALHVSGDLTVKDTRVTLKTNQSGSMSYTLSAKNLTIENSTVTAVAGNSNGSSIAIAVSTAATITNSTVTATAGSATHSVGLQTTGLTVVDSTVKATGSAAGTYSYGIYLNGAGSFKDSDITAQAGDSGVASNGIYTAGGVTADGGSLTAAGGTGGSSWGIYSDSHITFQNDAEISLSGGNGATNKQPTVTDHTGDPILVGNAADGSDAKPMDEWPAGEPFKYFFTKTQNPVTPYQPPVMRLDNFESATGEFNEIAYYAREARAGDIVTLKVALSELGKRFGLDFTKITVEYEVQGAAQLGGNYLYTGDPLYVDGIATDFMLGEGFNMMVAKVYYNGVYSGSLEPFYAWVE